MANIYESLTEDYLQPWVDGSTRARIVWTDTSGTEHETVASTKHRALSKLLTIRSRPGARVVSCTLEQGAGTEAVSKTILP